MRAFVAIKPCEIACKTLMDLQEDLDQGRSVPEENLHITLAFLDDQTTEVLETLHNTLLQIRVEQLQLTFAGVEARGGRNPALIWAGVEMSEPLSQLQLRVRTAAHQIGLELPRKRFRPHVTLARISRTMPVDPARLGAWLSRHGTFRAGPFPAEKFCLYHSQLTPDGPIYEVLAEYPLVPANSAFRE